MTPVFWILVAIFLVFIWAALSFTFKSVGKWLKDLINDVKNAFKSEDENKNE